MNKSVIKPVLLLALFILTIGTACNLTGGGAEETKEPDVIVVTATPESHTSNPVVTEPTTVSATEEPFNNNEPLDYFVEEFENGLDNYSYFVKHGDETKADVFAEDGKLKFSLNDYDIYYYVLYDPYTYGDVRLDVEVENLGVNTNSVSLVCRYSDDLGWYEFNVSSGGIYEIYYFDRIIVKGYSLIASGGSPNVNMGRDTNVYTAICEGDTLSLYINGTLAKSIEHKDLDRGQVGIGINSYDGYPVIMNIPWMEISEP